VPVAATRDASVWQLLRSDGRLVLCSPLAMGALQIRIDPDSGPFARRLRSSRRDEPLSRAVGLPKRQVAPSVVDATAGLCRDAMVLAHLGCRVIGLERVPALVMLAAAALQRSPLRQRLQVERADATGWLLTQPAAAAADVVYLDPMFDETGSAQVKKDMQACRALAGPAADTAELLRAARQFAGQRVVVKRHSHQPPIAEDVSFRVDGKRVRFDVYLSDPAAAPPR
jgi:16S rRNA (guanine1516-N2)-methyltransferase